VSQLDARAHGKRVQIIEAHASDRDTQHAIHGEAVGLWLLAGLLLVTGLLIVAQTLIRETYVEGRDDHVLASLGMTRLQLWTRTMLRALIILVAGSLGALGVMYVISPLMPIGIARLAEPAPGLSFDALVAGAGVAALIALPMLVLAAPAFLAVHVGNTEKSAKPRARHPFQGGSLPLPIALGSALAFDRRKGAGALPVRTTIGSLTVAFAGLAAALVFGASLSHLLGTPRAYGLTWDTAIGSATRDARAAEPILRSDTRVQGLAFGVTAVAFQIDGHAVDAELIDPPVKGPTATVVLAGRAPAGAAELALGTRTMRDLHLRIGEVVSAGLPGGLAEHMRIVGRVVLEPANTGPQTAFVTAQELRLGDGALTTYSNFDPREQRALPPAQAFIRFASGVNRAATDASSVKAIGGDAGVTNFVSPRDLIVIGRLQNLPFALTAVLALVAVSTLVHMLLAGVHRRRREYAILKTLGLAGRQMISTIICQADFLAVLAVIFGMLIGVVGGRWLWNLLVGGEGVVTEPRLPTTGLGVAAVAMIVVSTIFALGPAIVAERVSPATVLRVE
jgi:hypothetical protein